MADVLYPAVCYYQVALFKEPGPARQWVIILPMEANVVELRRYFDLTRQVVGETSEAGLLQCIVDAARAMTQSGVAVAGQGYAPGTHGKGFRIAVASIAPELTDSFSPPNCFARAAKLQLELMGANQIVRLTERDLRAHPIWRDLSCDHGPVRGIVAARLLDGSGQPDGLLIVSDRWGGDFTLEDEATLVHLSTLASAYLANLRERELAQAREEEAVARTKRLASRLHQRSERLARLEERHRLAQELHDSVSQSLYAISLTATAANNMLQRDPNRAGGMLDFVLSQARVAVTEMRSLVYELRSNALANEGLFVAFTRLAEAMEARWDLRVDLDIKCEPPASLEVKEAVYRIGQEALRNTARHARATAATLRIGCVDGIVILEESDDGVGFDPIGTSASHAGINFMRAQALRLNGTFDVKSLPGSGTRIRATLPARQHSTR
jgi:signal transduction histidine kinase